MSLNKQNIKSSILKYSFKYKWALLGMLIFCFVAITASVCSPYFLANATDIIINSFKNNELYYDLFIQALLLAVLFYFASSLFQYFLYMLSSYLSEKICYDLKKALNNKLNNINYSFFHNHTAGDILSCFTNDIDIIGEYVPLLFTSLLKSFNSLIVVYAVMFSVNVFITLFLLFIFVLNFIIVLVIAIKSQKYFDKRQDALGKLNGYVEESYTGISVIRFFKAKNNFENNFIPKNEYLYELNFKSTFLSRLMYPIINTSRFISYGVVIIFGGILFINNMFSIGSIQAFIQYIDIIIKPLNIISQFLNAGQQMISSSKRLIKVFNYGDANAMIVEQKCENLNYSNRNKVKSLTENENIFQIKKVSFCYDNKDNMILNDISFNVNKGEKIAIIGKTGSGKTTLLKLLLGLYKSTKGEILLSGNDMNQYKEKDLRDKLAVVMQDCWFFDGTILDNLKANKSNVSLEEIKNATKITRADEFIEQLPGGYYFKVSDQSDEISPSQKQLLSITRAIVADKQIYIMDEPTSNINSQQEKALIRNVLSYLKDKTVIIVTHKLSVLKYVDTAYEIDNSHIYKLNKK